MTVVVNYKVHIRDNYKEPTDGKVGEVCKSDILKNLAADDSSDNKSYAVEDNSWKKSSKNSKLT